MLFIVGFIILLYFIAFPPQVHAIVILPAIMLIPLVKLVALVIGAFSIPVGSAGILLAKITKKNKLVFIISFILILLISVLAAIVLRLTHPQNPWF